MTKFEKIYKAAQLNFFRNANSVIPPRTPGFNHPKGTKYLAALVAMLKHPVRAHQIESESTQQMLRWSGLCRSTKAGYVLTKLGKQYLECTKYLWEA